MDEMMNIGFKFEMRMGIWAMGTTQQHQMLTHLGE
jgi:hypothetical protein